MNISHSKPYPSATIILCNPYRIKPMPDKKFYILSPGEVETLKQAELESRRIQRLKEVLTHCA